MLWTSVLSCFIVQRDTMQVQATYIKWKAQNSEAVDTHSQDDTKYLWMFVCRGFMRGLHERASCEGFMRTLNLHQLATFQVVAKHCSYVRAAEELHFSQPAVSAQIRQLEESLGVKLFDQIGRKTHLTHAGEELFLYSQKIFTLIDETLETMESLRSPHYGRLSVGADTTVGTYVIPGLLGKFHQFYSEVEITLDVVNRAALVDALVNNRIDIAIV